MDKDEKTRYDRQVRLWGKATQEQLRLTEVHVSGITSVISEVIKNLVLAGVHSVVLKDAATPDAKDLKANFLLQGCDTGERKGDACVRRLQSLNPYVTVAVKNEGGGEAALSSGMSFRVRVSSIRSVADAFREICNLQNTHTDLFILVADLGRLMLMLLLSKRQAISYEEQLELLLSKNTALRPASFQRSLLLMRMAECPEDAPFFERLCFAKDVAEQYELWQLCHEDFERAASMSPVHFSGTAIEATMAGGVLAQLIIAAVGSANVGLQDGDYSWAVCDTSSSTDVQVGHLHVP